MSIPDHAVHQIVSGSSAGVETWSFGWWEDNTAGTFDGNLDGNAHWVTFRDHLLASMAPDQEIDRYDWYEYIGGVVDRHGGGNFTHVGTSAGSGLPLQLSCVITTRTTNLTRSGRGRMYLPTNGEAILSGTGHIWASTRVNQLVDDFAAFLTDRLTSSGVPVVVSRQHSVMRPIISVDADYIPDTQRRRRRQMSSARHTHSL